MAKIFDQINGDARPACAEYSEIDFTGFSPFTICCWFKSTANISNTIIFCKWGNNAQYAFSFNNKKVSFAVNDAGNNRIAAGVSDYNTGTWVHAAGVFDGSSVKMKINGGVTEDVTGGTVVTGISNSAENFQVAQYSSAGISATQFDGSIEHICVFNKALTNNELLTVMHNGPRLISGLTLWFPLIDASVADVNLAPVTGKTSVSGVNTSFTIDSNRPPIGYIFNTTITMGGGLVSTTPLTQGVSDNLNFPWADAATATLSAATVIGLDVTIVDKIIRNGSISGNNLALRDGIAFSVGPSGPVFVSVSDLGTFLDDSNLGIGYGLHVAD